MAYIDPQPGLVSRSSYRNCAMVVLCIITMPRVDAATLRTTPALTFGLLSMANPCFHCRVSPERPGAFPECRYNRAAWLMVA